MAKGDRIYIGIKSGQDVVSGEVTARQSGRRVEQEIGKDNGITWLTIREVTRGGTMVEEIRVQLTEVLLVKQSNVKEVK